MTPLGRIFHNWAVLKQPQLIEAILSRVERGVIEIVLPNGRQFRATGTQPGPSGRVDVHHPNFFRRLLRESDLGFGEMFMEGWWTTPDLQDLMDVIMLNNETLVQHFLGSRLFRLVARLRHLLNFNSPSGSRRNIASHYDLGNAFYSLWLDGTMTYSSALFRSEQETLTQAQQNKYAAIRDRLALTDGDRLLEVGCGWGGFAEYVARECGVKVTGLTISREQYEFARQRIFRAGLSDKVTIQLRDYRDERGTYSKVASIEMIEAVGENYWPVYFQSLVDRLRPGGIAVLQAITIADRLFPRYRTGVDFIQKHIFPGGMLPSTKVLQDQPKAVGLEWIGTETFADSYSRTLREWRYRFNDQWNQIAQLGFDDCFYRMWNFYLAACAAGFASRTTDVVQVAYRKEQ